MSKYFIRVSTCVHSVSKYTRIYAGWKAYIYFISEKSQAKRSAFNAKLLQMTRYIPKGLVYVNTIWKWAILRGSSDAEKILQKSNRNVIKRLEMQAAEMLSWYEISRIQTWFAATYIKAYLFYQENLSVIYQRHFLKSSQLLTTQLLPNFVSV